MKQAVSERDFSDAFQIPADLDYYSITHACSREQACVTL